MILDGLGDLVDEWPISLREYPFVYKGMRKKEYEIELEYYLSHTLEEIKTERYLPLWKQKQLQNGGDGMQRSTELLYWCDFDQFIHYDESTDTYHYDPELPERARVSFENWLKQKNQ